MVELLKEKSMEVIFSKQLQNEFTKKVTFIEKRSDGPDKVWSWKKSKINEIPERFTYVGKDGGPLPRFIEKV